MRFINDFSEFLKPEVEFNLTNRVLALMPSEENIRKDFQEMADNILDSITEGNKIEFKPGHKEVIVAVDVIKSNVEGILPGDVIYVKPGYTKLLCSLEEENKKGEKDLHAIANEDIFFIERKGKDQKV